MRVSNSNFINRPVHVSQVCISSAVAICEFNPATSSILAEWDVKLIQKKQSDLSRAREPRRLDARQCVFSSSTDL